MRAPFLFIINSLMFFYVIKPFSSTCVDDWIVTILLQLFLTTHEWLKHNISLQYRYTFKQKFHENLANDHFFESYQIHPIATVTNI